MGRPRTPTNVLERKGAFRKNPQRRRDDEPQPTGDIGDPPDALTGAEAAIWREMVEVIPPGVPTNADRHALETLCMLLAELRDQRRAFPASKLGHLRGLLGAFGLTPADRAKIEVPKGDDGDHWRE